jgi:protein O-mannosyl-transferase
MKPAKTAGPKAPGAGAAKTAGSKSPGAGAAKTAAPEWRWQPWAWAAAAVVLVFWAYGPALTGVWLFDDTVLPYGQPAFPTSLLFWLNRVRPVLMLTYWLNRQIAQGGSTYVFHATNLLIHLGAGGLMFAVVRRLLEWSGAEPARRNLLAGFAAGVFLLHPAMTEAVAYTAGRSESLSTMWTLAAFAVFLYRPRPEISWRRAAAVLLLFGLAMLSKEQTAVLPALLLLTDFWWNPGFSLQGIRANWRMYLPMAAGAVVAAVMFRGLVLGGSGAGFGIGVKWYEYLFTEFRALLVYVQQFLAPVNLTADWYFPVSKNIFDHGALACLAVLLALAGAAWYFRKRFPLAAYGFLVYLLLMAPTSSIIPIKDPVAERRLYFSVLGLLLIAVDLLGRVRLDRKALSVLCAVVMLACTIGTHTRAAVWGDDESFWKDTVQKAPENARAHFHLGFAWAEQERWFDALREYEQAARLAPADWDLLLDWGVAYLNVGKPQLALEKFQASVKLDNSAHAQTQIAEAYAQMERWPEALDALATGQKLEPNFPFLYVVRGMIHLKTGPCAEAVRDLRTALKLAVPGEAAYEQATRYLPQAEACAAGPR